MGKYQSSRGGRSGHGSRDNPRDRTRAPAPARTGDRPAPRNVPRLSLDLYGLHAVEAALLNPDRNVTAIYATTEQAETIADICDRARAAKIKRPDIHIAPRAAFDNALHADAVHQGVGLTCDPLPEVALDDIIHRIENTGKHGVIVLLDQVTDPHNMGAIIRSAAVFGASGIVVQRRHAPDLNALIAKTASGGVEHVPVAYETNLARSIDDLKDSGFFVVGLDERGDVALPDFKAPEKCVLVMGAEGPGIRRLIKDSCDQLVRLPTSDVMSSLNVSNAAAVALYQICAR